MLSRTSVSLNNTKHQVLYCRLAPWWSEHRCDVFVPPNLDIPRIISSNAALIDDISVMPLFDLFVMKVKGWRDHSTSFRLNFRTRVWADVGDIRALLNRAISERIWYPREKGRHTGKFMDLAHNLVSSFIRRQEGRESFRVSVSLCNLPMSDMGECGTSYYVRFSRVALRIPQCVL